MSISDSLHQYEAQPKSFPSGRPLELSVTYERFEEATLDVLGDTYAAIADFEREELAVGPEEHFCVRVRRVGVKVGVRE